MGLRGLSGAEAGVGEAVAHLKLFILPTGMEKLTDIGPVEGDKPRTVAEILYEHLFTRADQEATIKISPGCIRRETRPRGRGAYG